MPSIRILPDDPSYPEALRVLTTRDAPDPPTLYLRGALPALPGVALVGTRAASDGALAFARELAAALGAAGFCIWSGGARGVDAAAHAGALDAGAPTVLVAGGGLDRPYPPEHAPLFGRVLASGGALLARVPDDAPPRPLHFVQRNAVLAAMTRATVVIEAGVESGARSTAASARRLGRPVLAVPSAPWDPRGAGCLLEIALGARLVTRAADVLAALGEPPLPPPSPPPPPRARARRAQAGAGGRGAREGTSARSQAGAGAGARVAREGASVRAQAGARDDAAIRSSDDHPLSADERAVLAALDAGPAYLDEVCERAGLCPPRASGALLTLTLHAVVVEGPAGSYRRVRR